jgi:hypothetical protein
MAGLTGVVADIGIRFRAQARASAVKPATTNNRAAALCEIHVPLLVLNVS